MSLPSGVWSTTGPLSQAQYEAIRPMLEVAAELGRATVGDPPRQWRWSPFNAETPEPPELPDDAITPDEAEPLPPDEPVKTDPVSEEPQ